MTTDPADYPIGTVLRNPGTGRVAVRFQVDDSSGRGMHAWYVPVPNAEARILHHIEVHGWQLVELPAGVAEVVRAVLERQAGEVARLTRERDEARQELASFYAASHSLAGMFWLDPEDHQALDVLGGIREWLAAWRADSSRVPEGWQSLVRKGWSVGARPAIPADAVTLPDNWETQIRQALNARSYDISEAGPLPGTSSHDRDADRCADEIAGDIVVLINDWMSAPVSGSDTSGDGGDR